MNKEAIARKAKADGCRWATVSPSQHGEDLPFLDKDTACMVAKNNGGSVMGMDNYLKTFEGRRFEKSEA